MKLLKIKITAKQIVRSCTNNMPFDRLIPWIDDDGIEREHWIHATGEEIFTRIWNGKHGFAPTYVFPDGSVG